MRSGNQDIADRYSMECISLQKGHMKNLAREASHADTEHIKGLMGKACFPMYYGEGRAYIWDFKTGRYVKNLKAHDGVCLGATWHPINTSTIATCGWGTKASPGTIKLWD